jgi:peptidoglycan hydrolase-like protein with peptidoglycan-binding domain
LVEPKSSDVKGSDVKPLELKAPETKAPEMKASEVKPADPLTGLLKATMGSTRASVSMVPRPPAPIPVSHNDSSLSPGGTRRVAAVQRALTEFGYGQLKPTGTIGSETQAAITRFERERRIPVTGQMSDRLVHELSAMIGRPIE